MNDIQQTIREYETSCAMLEMRLEELNEEILLLLHQGGVLKNRMDRRYLLFSELTEMRGALRELREYVQQTQQRDGRVKNAM